MPLTDREKAILQDIEKNLKAEDPGFARGVRSPWKSHVRRIKLGAALFVGGLVTLFLFFVSKLAVVGVVAYAAMVGGIVLFAGAGSRMASERMQGVTSRERMTRGFKDFEARLRDRYKKS